MPPIANLYLPGATACALRIRIVLRVDVTLTRTTSPARDRVAARGLPLVVNMIVPVNVLVVHLRFTHDRTVMVPAAPVSPFGPVAPTAPVSPTGP